MVQFSPVKFGSMLLSSQLARHWLLTSTVAAAATALTVVFVQRTMRKQPLSPEEQEAQRRQRLTEYGRIVDGSLIAALSGSEPRAVIYQYRIGGVTYERSQDISTLVSLIGDLRPDYPVQVRYNRANPADSIVVSETWNGLFNELWHGGDGGRAETKV